MEGEDGGNKYPVVLFMEYVPKRALKGQGNGEDTSEALN